MTVGPVKQIHPQIDFQISDLLIERRLSDMQTQRCSAEMQFLSNSDNIEQKSALFRGTRASPMGPAGLALDSNVTDSLVLLTDNLIFLKDAPKFSVLWYRNFDFYSKFDGSRL